MKIEKAVQESQLVLPHQIYIHTQHNHSKLECVTHMLLILHVMYVYSNCNVYCTYFNPIILTEWYEGGGRESKWKSDDRVGGSD